MRASVATAFTARGPRGWWRGKALACGGRWSASADCPSSRWSARRAGRCAALPPSLPRVRISSGPSTARRPVVRLTLGKQCLCSVFFFRPLCFRSFAGGQSGAPLRPSVCTCGRSPSRVSPPEYRIAFLLCLARVTWMERPPVHGVCGAYCFFRCLSAPLRDITGPSGRLSRSVEV